MKKKLRDQVFEIINQNWPIHPSGICKILNLELNVSNISKISYHYGILKKEGKIHTKRVDRALVAWPVGIEKIRVAHELIRD